MDDLEEKCFLLLLAAVSLAFAWILMPFSGAILWGTVFAIVFSPMYRSLLRTMPRHPGLAALVTVTTIVLIVILPLTVIGALVFQEATGVYQQIEAGELDFGRFFRETLQALPGWATAALERAGLGDFRAVQARLAEMLGRGSQLIAAHALDIGQNTFDLVISFAVALYLLFFLLRDGERLLARIRDALPLRAEQRRELFGRFTTVIRATVKGSIVVAVIQGVLGGLMFWLLGIQAAALWGAVMAVLSLLPAIGSALIWLPVGAYLLLTGAVWDGIILIGYGILVIGMVDNFLRPLLVGKDTRMPDYLVLLSTLGGIAIFGINGLVIGPVIAAMFIAAWDLFAARREPPAA